MPAPTLSRRHFLHDCCQAITGLGMYSTLAQLRVLGAVAQPDPGYKALVCLFLAGGNDGNNLIVPTDASTYSTYSTGRTTLAIPRTSLLGIIPRTTDGRTWGFHPAVPELRDLFAGGRLAVLANVGTLLYPTTRAQYASSAVPLPPQLFAHNDQQIEWQSSVPDQPFRTGWGGRLADLVNAANTNARFSMSITVDGQNYFQTANTVMPFAVGTGGVIPFNPAYAMQVHGPSMAAFRELQAAPTTDLYKAAVNDTTVRALADSELLSGVLAGPAPFTTAFPTTQLGQQLQMIARLIAAAPQLGLRRQIFFARLQGWDHHNAQVSPGDATGGAHATLLADVARSMKALYDATLEMGVSNQVVQFTASDFGRTLRSNGDGSDHGWGNHQLILGGTVRGGDIYGRMPDLTVDGPDDTDHGRWIPTTSVDEYSATLATWFGVSASDLPTVLPNIGRFARPGLGFL